MNQWAPLIEEASKKFGIPDIWIRAVMRMESGGQTMLGGVPITSPAGAMGLMQLMPDTYAEMQARYGLGADPYNPHDNILAGAAYLREMYVRYGYPDLFAAYNAGPARFDAFLYRGAPFPEETTAYLDRLGQLKLSALAWPMALPENAEATSRRTVSQVLPAAMAAASDANGMEGFTPSSQGMFVPLQRH
ncbi:lytic transglycosylase domain-containing protein [Acidocella sp.]|uniref:lytic transglycosylase domain-containing protein n=1 Tax=Acidocella sp. TaxID=50710 RepID=UPI0026320FF0|nr:lytic transglycosylase domain-containing protein [Acidocella sp.]